MSIWSIFENSEVADEQSCLNHHWKSGRLGAFGHGQLITILGFFNWKMFLCSYYDENILHHIHKVDDTRRSWHFYHLSLCGDSLSGVKTINFKKGGQKFYMPIPKHIAQIFIKKFFTEQLLRKNPLFLSFLKHCATFHQ